MGRDKARLMLGGETVIQRTARALAAAVDEIVVVGSPGAELPAIEVDCPLTRVEDPVEGEGPLVGIAAGLAVVRAPISIVLGVDMPFAQPALLRLIASEVRAPARWAMPVADSRPQPLCSAFARDALEVLRAHIAAGDRAPLAAAADLRMVRIPREAWAAADPEGITFIDLDTPDDLARAEAILLARGG